MYRKQQRGIRAPRELHEAEFDIVWPLYVMNENEENDETLRMSCALEAECMVATMDSLRSTLSSMSSTTTTMTNEHHYYVRFSDVRGRVFDYVTQIRRILLASLPLEQSLEHQRSNTGTHSSLRSESMRCLERVEKRYIKVAAS